MPWTETTRLHYRRDGLVFSSDLTDAEWLFLSEMIPGPSGIGRPRRTDMRMVMNAIFYVLRTGCPWRSLPKPFPPRSTVQSYFYQWRDDGTWHSINRRLVRRMRQGHGRKGTPSACIIDSQSVKTTESGGPRGFDAAKKVKGRKRHIVTDTQGSLLEVLVHAADLQDRHAAVPLLQRVGQRFPALRHAFADYAYRGQKLIDALADTGQWTIDIVTTTGAPSTFKPQPRRWVVERTFAWLNRNRRLAKDFERTIPSQTAWILLASIQISIRRCARP